MQTSRNATRPLATALLAAGALVAGACQRYPYDPSKATRAYPEQLAQASVADIQAIPDLANGRLRLVNPTATGYADFHLWLNRRYMRHVDALAAGQTIDLPIDSFWDERGEGPFPGGWFRYFQPTPIVLVQIEPGNGAPLVGLVAKPPDKPQR